MMVTSSKKAHQFQKITIPEARIKFLLAKSQCAELKSNIHTNFKYCKRILTSYSVTRKTTYHAMPYKIETDDITASLILKGSSSKIPQDNTRNGNQNSLSLSRSNTSNTKVNSPPKDYISQIPLNRSNKIAKMIDQIDKYKKINHWTNRIRKKYKAIMTKKATNMKNHSLQMSHNNNSSIDFTNLSIDTLGEQELKKKLQQACESEHRKNKIFKGSCVPKKQLNTIDVHVDNSPIEILQLLPQETATGYWKSPHGNGVYKKRKIKKLSYHGHTLEIPYSQSKANKMQDSEVQISDNVISQYVITGHSTNYSTHDQDYKVDNKGIIEVIVNPRRKGKYSFS